AEASAPLLGVARTLGAPVVTTWMGKGAIPEDDPLFGGAIGDTGSTCGNRLAAEADVLLAVGCRFTDWSASSYRRGVTFGIPPSRLVQIDVDPHELGKNYPVEIGIVADAQSALVDLLSALEERHPSPDDAYREEIAGLKAEWSRLQDGKRLSEARPMTQARAIREIRAAADRGAIVTSGAGVVQAVVRQDWETYEPRTHITSGGFSTMGFTVPAALGAKLAQPDRQVIAMAGDGDFLQTMQEIALAAMWDLPVLFVVLNNHGWISIKGGQIATFGRPTMTDFVCPDGSSYSPDFRAVGHAFGLESSRVDDPAELRAQAARLLASGGPALLEVTVAREHPDAGLIKTGWWDVPVHEGRTEARAAYEAGRAEEQHL
nr:thiamine pyrophosphate-binding protein [Chloroflexota bacterium]